MKFSDSVVVFDYAKFPILGNLATGAVIGLDSAEERVCRDAFEAGSKELFTDDFSPEFCSALSEGKFFREEHDGNLSRSVYLHVTQRCNLNCVGCYSVNSKRNASPDLPLADIEVILTKLKGLNVDSLVISGGEPFLRKDLPDIVSFAKTKGIRSVSVITNGTSIKREILQRLSGAVDRIAVSFDGSSSSSESYIRGYQRFADLKKSILAIEEEGINAHIIATIHAFNIQDIPSYFELARSLNVGINFGLLSCTADDKHSKRLIPDDNALERLAEILIENAGQNAFSCGFNLNGSISARGWCGAGRTCLSVSHEGLLYPCHMLQFDGYTIANLLKDSLADVEEKIDNSPFSTLDVESISGCSNCGMKYLCGGGCRARSLYAYGDVRSCGPYCALAKNFMVCLAICLEDSMRNRLIPTVNMSNYGHSLLVIVSNN